MKTPLLLAVLAAVLGGCETAPRPHGPSGRAHLFDGMGRHQRPVTTDVPLARRYFDQGLVLTYGFNHDEAVRSFETAIDLDPEFAMAYWGKALALGPNINAPMSAEQGAQAFAAAQQALARADQAAPVERALIGALTARYQDPPPADRAALDRAYAAAMREVWQRFPDDTDVGTLFAESLLDLSPWDQWTKDGQPRPDTEELVATLERVMELDPEHPGANHYYIHAVEASPNPERALPAADRLARLVPGIGHLVHMPAHIYVQTGRYADSIACNTEAVRVDDEYFAKAGPQGIYEFYHAHNHHFLAYSAMFEGNYAVALKAARDVVADLPAAFLPDPSIAEFLPMVLHVFIRFGRWDDILAEPAPRADQPYASAMWRYARGVALANTRRLAAAKAEVAAFEQAAAAVPEDQLVFIVPAPDVLAVAREMLAGEIAFHAGRKDAAFAHLRKAVAAEDALRYSEPSPWMQPARHALGALLLQEGRIEQAEQAYREDLERHPGNGWALHGLAECLERRGATADAATVREQFAKAWSRADVEIRASCFCRQP